MKPMRGSALQGSIRKFCRAHKVVAAFAVSAILLLPGCSQPEQASASAPSLDERLSQAMERLSEDIGPAGDLRAVTLHMMGYEYVTELGSNGVMRYAPPMMGTTYCTPDLWRWAYHGEVFEARPASAVEACSEMWYGEPSEELWVVVRGDPVEGGTDILVEYLDENRTRQTYRLDHKDRIREIVEDGEIRAKISFRYGTRTGIDVPAATARYPESISERREFDSGRLSIRFDYNGSGVPLIEFEMRIQDADVAFELSDSVQEARGFTFQFSDSGDGLLGAGDNLELQHAQWEGQHDHDIFIWDRWADRPINYNHVCEGGVC